jgi:hypothetical protein
MQTVIRNDKQSCPPERNYIRSFFVNNKENYKNREMLIAISRENMRIQEIKANDCPILIHTTLFLFILQTTC